MALPPNYILEKKSVKHARIRVSDNLIVRVLVPTNFSAGDIHLLIKKKQKWIDKKLADFTKTKDQISLHHNQLLLYGNRYNYFFTANLYNKVIINHTSKTIQSNTNLLEETEQLKWYRRFAKLELNNRLIVLAKRHKLRYNKVFIRNQRTKWGNCSSERNISLNWRLIKAPQFVIDYLIVHELLHTRIMNHQQKFWVELKRIYPQYQEAIKWLERYGKSL